MSKLKKKPIKKEIQICIDFYGIAKEAELLVQVKGKPKCSIIKQKNHK